MNPIQQTISESIEAIRHHDDTSAKQLIKQMQAFLNSAEARDIDSDTRENVQNTLTYLKLTAIPQLSDEEVANVLRMSYLDSFDAEIDMENRLTTKLFFVPEIPRDELRKKLKQALLENNQRLGPFTVGQWIAEFEKEYDVKSRTLSASVDFVRNNRNTLTLDPTLRTHLKDLLYTYDYLLVTTLPFTGPSLENFLASDFGKNTGTPVGSTPSFHSNRNLPRESGTQNISEMKIENLPINTAMERYPAVGEQLITSNHIKLKIFPEPVRPSIKNWLSDYTFTIGVSNYDPIVRGNYLFKSENGRTLSPQDREKLAIIIKSFEEKIPLAINVNTNQVIFSAPKKREAFQTSTTKLTPLRNTPPTEIKRGQESYNQPQKIQEPGQRFQSDQQRLSAWRRDLPQKETVMNESEAENVRFSSPQIFSTEKPTEIPRPASQSNPRPQIARINYTTPPRPIPKNVVDLREENSM